MWTQGKGGRGAKWSVGTGRRGKEKGWDPAEDAVLHGDRDALEAHVVFELLNDLALLAGEAAHLGDAALDLGEKGAEDDDAGGHEDHADELLVRVVR